MKNQIQFLKRNTLWILFIGLFILAVWTRKDASIFISQGAYGLGKYIAWAIFICFLAYSIYCSTKENFFKSLIKITKLLWARQIGIDLYIGLILPLGLIYLNGGVFIFSLWLIPVLLYANLATLLFLALNYDSLISQFIL